MTLTRSLVQRDRGLLWHPYASLTGAPPYAVLDGAGVRLRLEAADGTQFDVIDGMSSWWSAIHGYRNPVLDEAVRTQIGQFSHVMFGGLTHEPAIRLAERLHDLTRGQFAHVFFCDSGSVSVEVALKMATQYQAARGRPARRHFLALRGGYHGDTTGAMSVCDPIGSMHAEFAGLLPEQFFLSRPPAATLVDGELVADTALVDAWIAELEQLVDHHGDEIAAIIVEPILQGAGGMYVYAPRCLQVLREIATAHGMLLILDEIATGFGRTGRLFASDWAGITADILCVGKALTGGYLSLAAVLCSETVGAVITASANGAMLHGPTFMANPLACAVADASLGLLGDSWTARVATIEAGLQDALAPAAALSSVSQVRVLGGVGVVELHDGVNTVAVTRRALEAGVWLRPFRNLVYTMPPYISTPDDVRTIGAAITTAVAQVHG